MKKIVAYYRVSTKKQGQSGLGLEAQKAAVEAYVGDERAKIIANYVEIESGKLADRPELAQAIAHAKYERATLVVAKLDRLARNVAFLSALMDAGVEFVACDNRHANRLTIHILAAVAENEAVAISARTKAALQAAKARGVKLGSSRPGHWKGREDRRRAGGTRGLKVAAQRRADAAQSAYQFLYPVVRKLRAAEYTFQAIADHLNGAGHTTRQGKAWTATAAMRICKRALREKSL